MRVVVVVLCVVALLASGCTYRFGGGARSSASPLAMSLPGSVVVAGPSVGTSSKTEATIYYIAGGAVIVGGAAIAVYDYTSDLGAIDGLGYYIAGLVVVCGIYLIARGAMVSNSGSNQTMIGPYQPPPPAPAPAPAPVEPAPAPGG